jgi:hypothetical protein
MIRVMKSQKRAEKTPRLSGPAPTIMKAFTEEVRTCQGKKIETNNKVRRVRNLTTENGTPAKEVKVAARRATVPNTKANGSLARSIPTISETLKAQFKEDDNVNTLLRDRAVKQARLAKPMHLPAKANLFSEAHEPRIGMQ